MVSSPSWPNIPSLRGRQDDGIAEFDEALYRGINRERLLRLSRIAEDLALFYGIVQTRRRGRDRRPERHISHRRVRATTLHSTTAPFSVDKECQIPATARALLGHLALPDTAPGVAGHPCRASAHGQLAAVSHDTG